MFGLSEVFKIVLIKTILRVGIGLVRKVFCKFVSMVCSFSKAHFDFEPSRARLWAQPGAQPENSGFILVCKTTSKYKNYSCY
jgi:hypothetical protein